MSSSSKRHGRELRLIESGADAIKEALAGRAEWGVSEMALYLIAIEGRIDEVLRSDDPCGQVESAVRSVRRAVKMAGYGLRCSEGDGRRRYMVPQFMAMQIVLGMADGGRRSPQARFLSAMDQDDLDSFGEEGRHLYGSGDPRLLHLEVVAYLICMVVEMLDPEGRSVDLAGLQRDFWSISELADEIRHGDVRPEKTAATVNHFFDLLAKMEHRDSYLVHRPGRSYGVSEGRNAAIAAAAGSGMHIDDFIADLVLQPEHVLPYYSWNPW